MASICVVGSGPAGSFAAVELAEAGHEVTILETGSGNRDSDAAAYVAAIHLPPGATHDLGFSRQIGGASNLWAGRVAALDPIDFEFRQWVPDSGWPIGHDALAGYYDKAAGIMGVPSPAATTAPVPAGWEKLLGGPLWPKQFVWNRPPFNTASYLGEAMPRLGGRLRLIADAHVLRLVEEADGGRVRAADAVIGGEAVQVSADIFILAAGGIETPRIMLNSMGRNRNGIGEATDLIGRYLSTHAKADMGVLVLERRVPTTTPMFAVQPVGKAYLRTGLGLSAARQRALHGLNHCVQLSPLPEHRLGRWRRRGGGRAGADPSLLRGDAERHGILAEAGLVARVIARRLAGLPATTRLFVCRAFLDQHPNRDNTVRLSERTDRYGYRKAEIDWRFSAADRHSVIAFFEELDAAFRQAGLGPVDHAGLTAMEHWPLRALHSHFMGTTRIGRDHTSGVVDANCRVFGLDNLYVAGPSTFPTAGYANPYLTIAAMALRLADHIARVHRAGHAPGRPFTILARES